MLFTITIQFLLQILLPALFLAELFRKSFESKRAWLIKVLLFGLTFLFIFLTARWDFFTYYLRVFLPLLFIVGSYVAYRKISPKPVPSSEKKQRMGMAVNVVLIAGLIWLNMQALVGYTYPTEAVSLSYPLKNGSYYVGGGGSSRWINNHNAFPPQDYALDILQLNKWGNRASGFWPTSLQSYAIFGDTIYSPCGGKIVKVVDSLPDQIPPDQDRQNLAGNNVVILYEGVEILLAHMQQGSIAVQEGEIVQVGQIIGQVGNSGNTSQPHLHIHAERGGKIGEILSGEGVPIVFDNRFLVRTSLFINFKQ